MSNWIKQDWNSDIIYVMSSHLHSFGCTRTNGSFRNDGLVHAEKKGFITQGTDVQNLQGY